MRIMVGLVLVFWCAGCCGVPGHRSTVSEDDGAGDMAVRKVQIPLGIVEWPEMRRVDKMGKEK